MRGPLPTNGFGFGLAPAPPPPQHPGPRTALGAKSVPNKHREWSDGCSRVCVPARPIDPVRILLPSGWQRPPGPRCAGPQCLWAGTAGGLGGGWACGGGTSWLPDSRLPRVTASLAGNTGNFQVLPTRPPLWKQQLLSLAIPVFPGGPSCVPIHPCEALWWAEVPAGRTWGPSPPHSPGRVT